MPKVDFILIIIINKFIIRAFSSKTWTQLYYKTFKFGCVKAAPLILEREGNVNGNITHSS